MNNSFYDDNDLREIDNQIGEVIGQPTLVDKMQNQNDKIQAARANWGNEFKKYWYIYVPLIVSSVFTAMLGLYMGLAPYVQNNLDGSKTLTFNTDWAHLFTAVIYVVAFLYVTEIGGGIFHHLFHEREEGNTTQFWTMLIGMGVSVIGILGTGISGGMVVSSALGFLTEFREVPASAQKWVVSVIPAMVALHFVLFAAYKLSSRKSKAERLARENDEKLELDNQVRMKGIQAIGKRRIQAAAIRTYERLVMDGLMSQSEAEWALNSGLSLYEIEKKLGRDLTGDQKVGAPSAQRESRPALPEEHESVYHPVIRPKSIMRCMECGKPSGDDLFCSDQCEADHLEKSLRHNSNRLNELKPQQQSVQKKSQPLYNEPTYKPQRQEPVSNEWQPTHFTQKHETGDTESFIAAENLYMNGDVPTIRKGERYTGTDGYVPSMGSAWQIRQDGSDEVITTLGASSYFLINPYSKYNGNQPAKMVRTNGHKPGF